MDRATNRSEPKANSAEAASPSLKPARRTRGGVSVDSPWVLRTSRLRLRPLAAADREPFIEMLRESRASLASYVPLHEPGESDDHLFDRQLALTHASNASPSSMSMV